MPKPNLTKVFAAARQIASKPAGTFHSFIFQHKVSIGVLRLNVDGEMAKLAESARDAKVAGIVARHIEQACHEIACLPGVQSVFNDAEVPMLATLAETISLVRQVAPNDTKALVESIDEIEKMVRKDFPSHD